MSITKQLLFLELNEINIEAVERYCALGRLPNFRELLSTHGWARTSSEQRYEELEPWIQWVTAHTGLSLAQHGVFRLGDIVKTDHLQIWEYLESQGLRVGAISPMNAKNRLRGAAFFVPDPWTGTPVTARGNLRSLYRAIAQAVNDNAQSKITVESALRLLAGFLNYANPRNYAWYAQLAASALKGGWRKAIFLDLLLSDVFVKEVARNRPDFATLFLNAGAHIQHHYMFSAAYYQGPHKSPSWYLPEGVDPVFEVYEAYDRIIARIRVRFPEARLMIATGLHQEPHGRVTYYWRLKNHSEFLSRIGVPLVRVEPRMSRDFLVVCRSADEARRAERILDGAITNAGVKLFDVDNRGTDLFVMLTYPHEIEEPLTFSSEGASYALSPDDVAFVALKNGEHNGTGYFIDTGRAFDRGGVEFPLRDIPDVVSRALGVREFSSVHRSPAGAGVRAGESAVAVA